MNPFQLVYKTLFDLIAAREDFKNLVRIGNQIRFDDDTNRDPIKLEVAPADLPEVVLTTNGTGVVSLFNTSSTTMCIRNYAWMLATGDFRVNQLFDVEWAIFTGMLEWQTELSALKWCDKPFVKRVDFTDVTEGFTDPEQNRNITGWSAIWACEVEMHFVTKDLKDGCP